MIKILKFRYSFCLASKIKSATTPEIIFNLHSEHDCHTKDRIQMLSKLTEMKISDVDKFNQIFAKVNSLEGVDYEEMLDYLIILKNLKQNQFRYQMQVKLLNQSISSVNNNVDALNLQQLVHFYSSLQFLGKQVETNLQIRIHKNIMQYPEDLTNEMILEIFKSSAQRYKSSLFKEWGIIMTCISKASKRKFTFDEQCDLFYYIAKLQIQLNSQHQLLPYWLYSMKTYIKQNLEQVQETQVIQLLQSFKYLPPNFPQDIFLELNQMVLLTLEHQPDMISLQFLCRYIKTTSNRMDLADQQKLVYLIEKKLIEPQDLESVDNLCRILNQLPKSQKIVQYLKDTLKNNTSSMIPFYLTTYLKMENEDIQDLIDKFQVNDLQLFDLYRLFTLLNESSLQFEEVKQKIILEIKDDPRNLFYYSFIHPYQSKYCPALLKLAKEEITEKIKQDKGKIILYLRNIYLGILTKEDADEWLQKLEQFYTQQTITSINNFIENVTFHGHYSVPKLYFIFTYFKNSKMQPFFFRIINFIKMQQQVIQILIENPAIFDLMLEYLEINYQNIVTLNKLKQPFLISTLVHRFEQDGFYSNKFRQFFRRINSFVMQNQMDSQYIQYANKYDAIDEEFAQEFMPYASGDIVVWSILFKHQPQQGKELFNAILYNLQNSRKQNNVACLLRLSPQYIESVNKELENQVKNQLNEQYADQLLETLFSINPDFYHQNPTAYKKYLDLAYSCLMSNHLNSYIYGQFLIVLEHFAKLQYYQPLLLKYFAELYLKQFKPLQAEILVRSLQVLGNYQFYHLEMIKSLMKSMKEQEDTQNYINDLSYALFQLGVQDQQIYQDYLQIREQCKVEDSLGVLLLRALNENISKDDALKIIELYQDKLQEGEGVIFNEIKVKSHNNQKSQRIEIEGEYNENERGLTGVSKLKQILGKALDQNLEIVLFEQE